MKRLILAACLAAALGGASAAEVTVSSVVQNPVTRHVTVSYSLADGPAIVTFEVTTNGVSAGADKARFAYGDVYRKVSGDGSHSFTWPLAEAWPDAPALESMAVVVKAWSLDAPPPYMVLDLIGNFGIAFYPAEEAMPYPVGNMLYKTSSMVFRKIPASGVTWTMGDDRSTARTRHRVAFTHDYYIGIYPVTLQQYSLVASMKDYSPAQALSNTELAKAYQGDLTPYGRARPVVGPSFKYYLRGSVSTAAYNWPVGRSVASSMFMQAMRNRFPMTFDLPTSAQWEYACRAGRGTDFNDGSSSSGAGVGWFVENNAEDPEWVEGLPHAVGLKKPNAWGLYDMHGNVFEMTLDRNTTLAPSADPETAVSEPEGSTTESGDNRQVRGGSFLSGAADYPAGSFTSMDAGVQRVDLGFRLAAPAAINN